MKDKNIKLYYSGPVFEDGLDKFVEGIYDKFSKTGEVVEFPERGFLWYGKVVVSREKGFPKEFLKSLFSQSQEYVPEQVSCGEKSDYPLLEDIIKEEQGNCFGLSKGFNFFRNVKDIEDVSACFDSF